MKQNGNVLVKKTTCLRDSELRSREKVFKKTNEGREKRKSDKLKIFLRASFKIILRVTAVVSVSSCFNFNYSRQDEIKM